MSNSLARGESEEANELPDSVEGVGGSCNWFKFMCRPGSGTLPASSISDLEGSEWLRR